MKEQAVQLLHNNIFLLFLIISLGKLVERINIRGFSLGIASIFLIASVFGYFGYILPTDFQTLGLVMFVYCIGIETGPQILAALRGHLLDILILPVIYLLLLALLVLACIPYLKIYSAGTYTGLYAGALISATSMSAVIDLFPDKSLSVAFGIIYPISLIGNLYLVPALPTLFRHKMDVWADIFMKQLKSTTTERIHATFRVTNPNIIGKPLSAIASQGDQDIIFTRYIENGEAQLANNDLILAENSHLVAVGSATDMAKLGLIIGPREDVDIPLTSETLEVRKIIVSNSTIAGQSLHELDLDNRSDLRITRIIRTSVDLSPLFVKHIQLGDKIVAVGTKEAIRQATFLLGDDIEEGYKTQFAPISIGIVLGILAGHIPLPFVHSLGITGGVLIFALFLGYKVKYLGILWQIPRPSNAFLKQLSLYIFFAGMGTNSGESLINTFIHPQSILLVIACFVLSFIPVILTYGIGTFIFRKNPFDVLGTIAGILTGTTILSAVSDRWKTDIPNYSFATAFPICMILTLGATEIMSIVLSWAV